MVMRLINRIMSACYQYNVFKQHNASGISMCHMHMSTRTYPSRLQMNSDIFFRALAEERHICGGPRGIALVATRTYGHGRLITILAFTQSMICVGPLWLDLRLGSFCCTECQPPDGAIEHMYSVRAPIRHAPLWGNTSPTHTPHQAVHSRLFFYAD